MKINKRTSLIIVATVLLAGLAILGAWRLYQLRGQAVAPTAPKLVPAQEVASCPAVSFPVSGGGGVGAGCPVPNSTCCRQPLTTCTDTLQCGSGYICNSGYCVKQTYDPNTNTCPAAGAPAPRTGSGADDGGISGQSAGSVGVGTPASPVPSSSPRASPSPSPSPSASPRTGATPSPSPTQAAPGTSTSAPSGTSAASATSKATAATASPKSLPEAGISWPTLGAVGGGILFLILGILLAF